MQVHQLKDILKIEKSLRQKPPHDMSSTGYNEQLSTNACVVALVQVGYRNSPFLQFFEKAT